MADKSSPATCAECEQLWKDYSDASLKRLAEAREGLRELDACESTQRLRNNGNTSRGRSAGRSKARRSEKEGSGTRIHSALLPKTYPTSELRSRWICGTYRRCKWPATTRRFWH